MASFMDNYAAEKKKAQDIQNTIDHQYRLSIATAENELYANGLLTMDNMNDPAKRAKYVAAFEKQALLGTKAIWETSPEGVKFDLSKMDIFQKAQAMNSAFGFDMTKFTETVDQLEDRATPDVLEREFYRSLNDAKKVYGTAPYTLVDMAKKDSILSEIDPRGFVFDPSKIKNRRDLLSIVEEYSANKAITPKFIETAKRKGFDLFPDRRIITPP